MPKFRHRPFRSYFYGKKSILLFFEDSSSTRIIPQFLVPLLESCREFSPLSDHAVRYWQKAHWGQRISLISDCLQLLVSRKMPMPFQMNFGPALIESVLEIFKKEDFLVSLEEFLSGEDIGKSLPSPKDSTVPSKISTIGVITCGRPRQLMRCVSSYSENAFDFSRSIEFAIVDDTSRPMEKSFFEQLGTIEKKFGCKILYAGRKEKEDFSRQLASFGIPLDVLKFSLFGMQDGRITVGGNRNSLLLHSVGELAFSVDDDTCGELFEPPGLKNGVLVHEGKDPQRIRNFPSREDALRHARKLHEDIFRPHENLLGKTVRQGISSLKEKEALVMADVDDAFCQEIMAGRAKSLISVSGLIGDAGTADPSFNFFLEGESRENIVESPEAFNAALHNREIMKFVERTTIRKPSHFMGALYGLDNTGVLPPFLPVFRDEDTVFFLLFKFLYKSACFAYIPRLLLHAPIDEAKVDEPDGRVGNYKREYVDVETIPDRGLTQSDLFIGLFMNSRFDIFEMDPASGVPCFGQLILKTMDQPDNEFQNLLKDFYIRKNSSDINAFGELLEKHDSRPRFWAEKIREQIEALKKAMENPRSIFHPFFVSEFGDQGAADYMRQMLRKYGELLIWWPQIISAARQLKERGVRLARPLEKL